jgi:ribonuclease BN (tRNA processing enzyme)
MSDTFTLTLYGTRGSRTIAGERFARFGGDTTCVGLQIGQRRLIFDAGSGIVKLGQDAAAAHRASGDPNPLKTWLFLTHAHYDHLCGLPYFGPLYAPNAITWLYGPRNPFMSFQETIERFIHPPYHPVPMYEMQGEVRWGEISEPEALYFLKGQDDPVPVRRCRPHLPAPDPDQVELVVSCMRGYNHPKSGVIIYKIQSQGRTVVLATDTEAYVLDDQRLIRFAQGADVLLHDGMYTEETYTSSPVPTQGWGHSTIESAVAVARAAAVKRLYLVHHDPAHDDDAMQAIEARAAALFPAARCGRDGLTLDLLQPHDAG